MTGFALGNLTGATLGQSSGGTLGVASDQYLLGGSPIGAVTSEVATHRTLTLTLRVSDATLRQHIRPAKTDENQIDVLVTDDGGFSAVDRANGANTFTLDFPPDREPLRQDGTYHVARYEESLVSQEVEEWSVEIEFVRDTHRRDTGLIDVQEQDTPAIGADAGATLGEATGFTLGGASGASLGNTRTDVVPDDWWGIGTRHGEIATTRVDAEFLGTGAEGVERFELIARLNFDQAYAFETALSRLDGVRVRQIVDESNLAVDDTAGDDNTITIDSPTPDTVPDGEHVVMGWESTRLNDAFQSITVQMAKKAN